MNEYWINGFLGVSLLLCGVVQRLCQTLCISSLQKTDSVALLCALWGISAFIYGMVYFYAKAFYGGFLPETETKAIHRSFFFIGLCSTVANIMEFVATNPTPGTLQASFGHMVIPITTGFVVVANPAFIQIFSSFALFGALLIAVGSMCHMGCIYLSGDGDMDRVFFNTLFLLAQVPKAWAFIAQQQYYALRRMNVFYFLFHVSAIQLFIGIVFSLMVPGMGDGHLSLRSFVELYQYVVSPISTEAKSLKPLGVTVCYVLSAMAGQLIQISLVRSASYRFNSLVILSVPTAVFVACRIGTQYRLLEGPAVSLAAEVFPYVFVLLGAAAYRLPASNTLSEDFALPPELLGDTPHASRRTSTADQSRIEISVPGDTKGKGGLHKRTYLTPENEKNARARPSQIRRPIIPILKINDDRPPLLRPVLMNTWNGSVPCEYTDYKRYVDSAKQDSRSREIISIVEQYTACHMISVGSKNDF